LCRIRAHFLAAITPIFVVITAILPPLLIVARGGLLPPPPRYAADYKEDKFDNNLS